LLAAKDAGSKVITIAIKFGGAPNSEHQDRINIGRSAGWGNKRHNTTNAPKGNHDIHPAGLEFSFISVSLWWERKTERQMTSTSSFPHPHQKKKKSGRREHAEST
jgi:hypothetical protein